MSIKKGDISEINLTQDLSYKQDRKELCMADERDYGVQCPYYICDDKKRTITCEGFARGSSVIQRYKRFADQRQQMKIFCCEYYRKCELYRMISAEKYEME